jgi:hypothetical protein
MVINCFSLELWCHWSVASTKGLKVEEEEEEDKDYPILERYKGKFVVLHVGLV